MRTNPLNCIIIAGLMVAAFATGVPAYTGLEILQISDSKVIPKFCKYRIVMKTVEQSGRERLTVMRGFMKTSIKNVLITERPKTAAGTVHLRKDTVIWSYYTTNHKLMKVSYQSIFMGSILNYGDVMATELAVDYDVKSMDDKSQEYRLELTPKKNREGYAKILLYIDKKTFYPIKREYFALSGMMLKTCEFKKVEWDKGKLKHVEEVFYEPVKDRKTIVTWDSFEHDVNIPEKYFNPEYLRNLSGE